MKVKIIRIPVGTSYQDEEKLINQAIEELEAENCWISQIAPRQNSCILMYDKYAFLKSTNEDKDEISNPNDNNENIYTYANKNNYYYETDLISENSVSLNYTYIVE